MAAFRWFDPPLRWLVTTETVPLTTVSVPRTTSEVVRGTVSVRGGTLSLVGGTQGVVRATVAVVVSHRNAPDPNRFGAMRHVCGGGRERNRFGIEPFRWLEPPGRWLGGRMRWLEAPTGWPGPRGRRLPALPPQQPREQAEHHAHQQAGDDGKRSKPPSAFNGTGGKVKRPIALLHREVAR